MTNSLSQLFFFYSIAIVLVSLAGIYCIIVSFNLIRALIGVELLMKAATLSIILVGYMTANMGFAQALVITLIVIEVVVMVVAGGIILNIFRHAETIDARELRELKG